MLLLLLLAVPAVFGVAVFFLGKRRITPGELAIQLVVAGALMVAGYYLTRWGGLQDYELWNGRIASAPSGSQRCCHSYDCNCREQCTTDKDNKRTCKQVCETCYKHSGDTYYEAYTSNGEQVFYSGCWGPGEGPPAAWSRIRIGEPTVVEHRYTNYVKADPSELLGDGGAAFDDAVPGYPQVVGWRARRFLFVDVTVDPVERLRLDAALDEVNADLGATKQVNIIVVVAGHADPAFFDALVRGWVGGKKNDVILVVGAPAFPAIAWARVWAWNKSTGGENTFTGSLAARVQALGSFDGDALLAIVRDEVGRNYQRRSFSELEYLMSRARPPLWAVVVLFGVGLGLSALLHLAFWRNRRRMRGRAPHERVRRLVARLRAWWRWRPDAEPSPRASGQEVEGVSSAGEPASGAAAEPAAPTAATEPAPAAAAEPAAPVPAPEPAAPAEPAEEPTPPVSLQTIEQLRRIRGADRIQQARVAGRTVVVPRKVFRPGDRCILFLPGCVLPDRPWSRALREHDFRVAPLEIHGVISDGYVVRVSDIFDRGGLFEDLDGDLSERLDVRWEP